MVSKKYELNKTDMSKVGKGLLIALGGAVLTYLETLIPQVNFGEWTPIAVAVNGVIVNFGRKFLVGR